MPVDIIVGAQWGDEGKGRIVDLLAAEADLVARFNGGDNAGHTVTVGTQTFKLHLVPSGIVHPHTTGIIGNGVVVNPITLITEIDALEKAGIPVPPERLRISYAAHLITPVHIALDRAQEQARGQAKIGTTLRGIGPAYTDKAARTGIRAEALLDMESFADVMDASVQAANVQLQSVYGAAPLSTQAVLDELYPAARRMAAYVGDITTLLQNSLRSGKRILAEGAQGTLLDLDHGTYPFVTSSYPTAPGALIGLGLGVGCVERVVGVTKAFQTRVGEGSFPTEASGEVAVHLRGTGANPWDEFGTTTGRPRRVGWLDLVLLRYAARINGFTELTLTKLDVLTGLETIKLCTGYCLRETAGEQKATYYELPTGPSRLEQYLPAYEELPGWQANLQGARKWEDLPVQAREYILRIEELVGVPVRIVSVGPERDQVVEIA